MLNWLIHYYANLNHYLLVFNYLTLRCIMTAVTAFLCSMIFGPILIRWLTKLHIGQIIRKEGPESHRIKKGTPTMGGVLMILSILVSTLLWANLKNPALWVCLLVMFGFAAIGFIDDFFKIGHHSTKGLKARWKYLWQSIFGLLAAFILYYYINHAIGTELIIPLFKNANVQLGLGMLVLSYFVIVGSSNAVNLTDGLDGLAILPIVLIAAGLAVFAYATSNHIYAEYLSIPYIPGAKEMAIICCAMVGSGLGFLWYNTYPAEIFMGDVGSLSLGATLGVISIVLRQELAFAIMAGVFVMETISVILQVGSFKLTGKRIFRMAPLHHHFELKGWAEPKIIVRFWIITVILVLFGLATLKLR